MNVFKVEPPKFMVVQSLEKLSALGDKFLRHIWTLWHKCPVVFKQLCIARVLCPKGSFSHQQPLYAASSSLLQEMVDQYGTDRHIGPVWKFSLKFIVFCCCDPVAGGAAALTHRGLTGRAPAASEECAPSFFQLNTWLRSSCCGCLIRCLEAVRPCFKAAGVLREWALWGWLFLYNWTLLQTSPVSHSWIKFLACLCCSVVVT